MAQSESSHDALLDSLADDFVRRFRAGERPALSEYIERYPELATNIRELFPSLVEMEQARAPPVPTPPAPTPTVRQLGDYRIVRELGRGGMGVVYISFSLTVIGPRWRKIRAASPGIRAIRRSS